MSCILRHWGIHLILVYSWARPAVLAAGKDRRGMFLFLLFLHFHSFFFLPCSFLSFFYYLSSFLWETIQNGPQGLVCRKTPTQFFPFKVAIFCMERNEIVLDLTIGTVMSWHINVSKHCCKNATSTHYLTDLKPESVMCIWKATVQHKIPVHILYI